MATGNLDPEAQEFHPRKQPLLVYAPPQFQPHGYYAYVTHPAALTYVIPVAAPVVISPNQLLPPPSATPTRTLLLSSVPSSASESVIRREMEAFGDVRLVQMERAGDGIVTVHFFNLRNAEKALRVIRERHMQVQTRVRNHEYGGGAAYRRRGVKFHAPPERGLIAGHAVWAQFAIPAWSTVPEGINQGTIVVFNLDAEISINSLRKIFQVYGNNNILKITPFRYLKSGFFLRERVSFCLFVVLFFFMVFQKGDNFIDAFRWREGSERDAIEGAPKVHRIL